MTNISVNGKQCHPNMRFFLLLMKLLLKMSYTTYSLDEKLQIFKYFKFGKKSPFFTFFTSCLAKWDVETPDACTTIHNCHNILQQN